MDIKYYSPVTGEEIFLEDDGLLHSKFNNMLYATDSNNNAILLKSPINGKPLYRDLNGYFKCEEEPDLYEIKDGKIVAVSSESENNAESEINKTIETNNNLDNSVYVDVKTSEKIDEIDSDNADDTSLIDVNTIQDNTIKANASIETILVVIILLLLCISIGVVLFVVL